MAAKLGDFFVNISTKADNKGIKEVSTGLDDLLGKAKKLAAGYLTFKLAKEALNADRAIIKDAAELGRLSADLGIATEQLEQFGRAFEIVGAGADEAYSTIRGLTKLIPALQMGDEGLAEAFGILGIGPQNLVNDQLENFDTIRKRFNQLNSAQQLYFVNTIGLGEKSLRVLRLNDEEYQNLLETAKEAPLLDKRGKERAEKYARTEARATYSVDSAKRSLALSTEPALKKLADAIREKGIDGAKFSNAIFLGSDEKDAQEKNLKYSEKDTAYSRIFGWNPITKKISDFVEDFVETNSKVLRGENSGRKDKKGLMPEDSRSREIERQIPKNWDGSKSIIINNNFQNKTDIQVKEAKDFEKDFAKHIPNIVSDVFGTTMKQASENFKSGVLQ